MKTIAAAEEENRFRAILGIVVRRPTQCPFVDRRRMLQSSCRFQNMSDRGQAASGHSLDLRYVVAGKAAADCLTEERLADLLSDEAWSESFWTPTS